jgi:hypothetical protein
MVWYGALGLVVVGFVLGVVVQAPGLS